MPFAATLVSKHAFNVTIESELAKMENMMEDYNDWAKFGTPQLQEILDKADHAAEEAAAKSMLKEKDVNVFDN